MSFLDFGILDLLDILLVAFLLYQSYRLIRGTVAINVLIGVAAIYFIWKLVQALNMELLSEILGKFIGVGVIALVIVFQQEIRKFLLVLGSTNFTRRSSFLKQLNLFSEDQAELDYKPIIEACGTLSRSLTGALIVLEGESRLGQYRSSGTCLNADLSAALLESIFNKTSPLHDGAVIISGQKIVAAGCILPLTESRDLPSRFGLRHRAAKGIAERTNAQAIVVSEETGDITLVRDERLHHKLSLEQLELLLKPKD